MILTEEEIKNLPVISEEELKKISVPTEQLIEKAILDFNEQADMIDTMYDNTT